MKELTAYLKVGGSCRIGDRIYFLNMTFTGLFYLDIHDLSIHFEHLFTEIPAERIRMAGNSMYYENAIYFFPSMANVIIRYDLLKRQESLINIKDFDEEHFLIIGCARVQDKVYMFPHNLGKGVFVFDLRKQVVERDEGLSRLFKPGFYCGITFLVRENQVLLSRFSGNEMIEVDLVSKEITFSKVFADDMQIYSVYFDGSEYWVLQMDSSEIYTWNRESDTIQVYKNENKSLENVKAGLYSNMIFLKDRVLILPLHLRNIFRMNKERKTIEEFKTIPEEFELIDNRFGYHAVCFQYTLLEDKILLYSDSGNMVMIYELSTGKLSGKKLLISEKDAPYLREILKKIIYANGAHIENDNVESLKNLTGVLDRGFRKKGMDDQENVGRLIYERC